MDEEIQAQINQLYEDSKILIEMLADRLTPEVLEELREYSFVGELGLLMNSMFAELSINKIPITTAEQDTLVKILAMFNDYEKQKYKFVNEGALSAFNVLE